MCRTAPKTARRPAVRRRPGFDGAGRGGPVTRRSPSGRSLQCRSEPRLCFPRAVPFQAMRPSLSGAGSSREIPRLEETIHIPGQPLRKDAMDSLPLQPPEATPVGTARFSFSFADGGGGRTVRFSSLGSFGFHDTGDRGTMPPPAAKSAGNGVSSPNRSGPAPASSPGRTAASRGRASPEPPATQATPPEGAARRTHPDPDSVPRSRPAHGLRTARGRSRKRPGGSIKAGRKSPEVRTSEIQGLTPIRFPKLQPATVGSRSCDRPTQRQNKRSRIRLDGIC